MAALTGNKRGGGIGPSFDLVVSAYVPVLYFSEKSLGVAWLYGVPSNGGIVVASLLKILLYSSMN